MKYIKHFGITLDHTYYQGTGNMPKTAVRLVPTLKSQQVIRNYRFKLINRHQGIEILQPLADGGAGPLMAIPDGLTFEFELQLPNHDLPLVTDFSPLTLETLLKGEEHLIYSNETLPADQFVLTTSTEKPRNYAYFSSFRPSENEVFFLPEKPAPGVVVSDFNISGIEGVTLPASYSEKEKKVTVDTTGLPANKKFEVAYPVYRKTPGTFTNIRIVNTPALRAMADAPDFQLPLDTLTADWIYYFVLPHMEDQNNIILEDLNTTRTGGTLSFVKNDVSPGSTDAIDRRLAGAYSDKSLVKVISDRSLPYRSVADPDIRMTYTPEAGTPLVYEPLETPSVEKGGKVILDLTQ